jgi:hypothetical protein
MLYYYLIYSHLILKVNESISHEGIYGMLFQEVSFFTFWAYTTIDLRQENKTHQTRNQ